MGAVAVLWQLKGLPRFVFWGCVELSTSSSSLLQVAVSDVTLPKIPAQGGSGFLVLKCSFAVGKVKLVTLCSEFLGQTR